MELAAKVSLGEIHPGRKVMRMRILRYLQTGYLLHLMAVCSCILAGLFMKQFLMHWQNGAGIWKLLLHGYLFLYFVTLIFFSQLDARSRFQNYKMVKDKLFQYGFDARLLRPFSYSRCQRDAIAVAARDLNMSKAWKKFSYASGFRSYHLLPDLVLRNPGILFTRAYWTKTLFAKAYHSKYFPW